MRTREEERLRVRTSMAVMRRRRRQEGQCVECGAASQRYRCGDCRSIAARRKRQAAQAKRLLAVVVMCVALVGCAGEELWTPYQECVDHCENTVHYGSAAANEAVCLYACTHDPHQQHTPYWDYCPHHEQGSDYWVSVGQCDTGYTDTTTERSERCSRN